MAAKWILGILFLFFIIVMIIFWYRKYKKSSELELHSLNRAKQRQEMKKSAGCSLSSPSITVTNVSQTTITVEVTATGEEGALNGVEIEWVGPFSGILPDTSALTTSKICRVNLPYPTTSLFAGETVTVTLGAINNNGAIFDTSLCQPTSTCSTIQATSCSAALLCGTQYAIRATALGGLRTSCPSAPSGWVLATTTACGGGGGSGTEDSSSSGSDSSDTEHEEEEEACKQGEVPCTRMHAFWQRYPEQWPSSVQSIVLGSNQYSKQQAMQILRTAENRRFKKNALISLAKELIVAILNINQGAPSTAVTSAVAQAHTLIGSSVIPPLGAGQLSKNAAQAVCMTLHLFNKGRIGPGRCKRQQRG